MPLIRPGLFESPRVRALKSDLHRLCYVELLLRADPAGNYHRAEFQLLAIWHKFGVKTKARVAKILADLVANDLVIFYEKNSGIYLHCPRFFQKSRWLKRIFPIFEGEIDENGNSVVEESSTKPVLRGDQQKLDVGMNRSRSEEELKPSATQPELSLVRRTVSDTRKAIGPPPDLGEPDAVPSTSWFQAAVDEIVEQSGRGSSYVLSARRFVGGLRKTYSDELLNAAIQEALSRPDVTNLQGYLKAVLKDKAKKSADDWRDPKTGLDRNGLDKDGYKPGFNPGVWSI